MFAKLMTADCDMIAYCKSMHAWSVAIHQSALLLVRRYCPYSSEAMCCSSMCSCPHAVLMSMHIVCLNTLVANVLSGCCKFAMHWSCCQLHQVQCPTPERQGSTHGLRSTSHKVTYIAFCDPWLTHPDRNERHLGCPRHTWVDIN